MMKNRYKQKDKADFIKDINLLTDYKGYVQFSHRPLMKKDIFEDTNPNIATNEEGFVYEAHFANEKESIMIRQQNEEWVVSKTDITNVEKENIEFYALEKTTHLKNVKSNWVKMAQVWAEEVDELCEDMGGKGMKVKKLKKVVFAGFEKEEKQDDKSTI